MAEYSESELVLPTLAFLDQAPAGLTTSELIRLLTDALRPTGRDAQILSGRNDTYFSQKVRNLVSHRTLEGRGLTTYEAARQLQVITAGGIAFLEGERARLGRADQTTRQRAERSGTRFADYRRANEAPRGARRIAFEVDPNEVDRASAEHARVQNALAVWVTGRELKPLRWAGGIAEFDLAWLEGETLFVAEVKSLTEINETGQLRLGLGQVLHYQALLRVTVAEVRAILAVERPPNDRRWVALCAEHGVSLVWPDTFDSLVVSAAPTEPG
jgi:hypothetical protein